MNTLHAPVLPLITFITGPDELARHNFANALANLDISTQVHSFASPLRDGALGTFFMGDPFIDIGAKQEEKIAGSARTFGEFLSAYHTFLQNFFPNTPILGALLGNAIADNLDFFAYFIIEDATPDFKADARYLVDRFSAPECLLVQLSPLEGNAGCVTSNRVRTHIVLPGVSPQDFLQNLQQESAT